MPHFVRRRVVVTEYHIVRHNVVVFRKIIVSFFLQNTHEFVRRNVIKGQRFSRRFQHKQWFIVRFWHIICKFQHIVRRVETVYRITHPHRVKVVDALNARAFFMSTIVVSTPFFMNSSENRFAIFLVLPVPENTHINIFFIIIFCILHDLPRQRNIRRPRPLRANRTISSDKTE